MIHALACVPPWAILTATPQVAFLCVGLILVVARGDSTNKILSCLMLSNMFERTKFDLGSQARGIEAVKEMGKRNLGINME